MKRLLLIFALVLSLGCWVTGAAADYVIWSQLPSNDETEAWLSVHDTGPIVSNDFQPSASSQVVAARWWGTHFQPWGSLPTYKFELKFHNNSGANMPVSGEGFATRMVDATRTLWGAVQGVPVYEYYAIFPGVSVASGTRYWLDIGWDKTLPSQNINWNWWSDVHPLQLAPAVQGNVYTPPASPHWGPWTYVSDHDDVSMVLYATPLPATLPLVGFGLAGLWVFAWRRRQ